MYKDFEQNQLYLTAVAVYKVADDFRKLLKWMVYNGR